MHADARRTYAFFAEAALGAALAAGLADALAGILGSMENWLRKEPGPG